jgi:hypothetical protein
MRGRIKFNRLQHKKLTANTDIYKQASYIIDTPKKAI